MMHEDPESDPHAWRGLTCPDCHGPLRTLTAPDFLTEVMPEIFKCDRCVVPVNKMGTTVHCGRIFFEADDGEIRPAHDAAHWLLDGE